MSYLNDYSKLNLDSFGRSVVKYHDALNPIIVDRDSLEVFKKESSFRKALESLLAELKAQQMKLNWFQKRL